MIKIPSSWKKFVTFLLFCVPFSLAAQELSHWSKKTESVRNSLSQPGDILQSQRFTGNQKILFILIKYPGDANSVISNSQAQSHKSIVIANLERNAYDSLSLTIDITPTLTMPNPDTYYKAFRAITLRIRTDAVLMAEQAGFDIDSYDREVIFSRKIWGGSAALGTMNKRTALLSHNLDYVTLHELGHTNGWRHANFWDVNGGSPISLNGTEIEYGDKFDLMGGSAGPTGPYTVNVYHLFNPWLKYRAGWLPDESILNVINSGTYTIQALDSTPQTGGSVTKYTALKIKKDLYRDYWIFFRSKEELANKGPVFVEVYNNNMRPTRLLDMTPGSQNDDWKDAALVVGQTFSDTQNGITVKTVSRSLTEVQVEVTVDANALANIDKIPVMDVISPSQGVTMKGAIDYEATAFDPDFGTTNGAGIAKVKLYLHQFSDLLIQSMRQGLDPPSPVDIVEFSDPPYLWQFDSNSSSRQLIPAIYSLIIRATSEDGGTHTVWFEHFIDNLGMPVTPALSSPSDNSIDVSTDTTLVWNAASGATSYRLQVSTAADFSTTFSDQSGLTSTTFQLSGLLNTTTYYWRVNATNATGTSGWSPSRKFTTVAGGFAPATPALLTPSDNATNIATDTTLVWAASNGATLYQLQISTDLGFSTIEFDQNGITNTFFFVTSLSNSTKYFWRIRASNVFGTSSWSTVWQFTTIVAGPAAPALFSPSDNAINISPAPILIWKPSGGATSYDVQVSAQSNFSTLEVDQSGLSDTTFQATGLSNSTMQYWRVRATNGGGTSPWSTVWRFTTIVAGPALPVLSSPLDSDMGVPTNPVLIWNSAEKATSYQLQVSIDSNFSTPLVDLSGIDTTFFQITGLLNDTIYYWRVRAANAGGISDWSSVRHFTTIVVAPAAPVLSSPADNALNLPVDLNLEWFDVIGAASYQIQISPQSDFLSGLITQSGLTQTSFQATELADETTYFWRVNATNAGGIGPWSTVRKFTTEPVNSVETGGEIPSDFRLGQNYPNPFNPATNIAFDLPKSEYVSLKVYNLLGTQVATLVSENLPAGKYTINFDASRLSSGLFFYKLQTNSFVETRKMLLVR